MYHTQGGQSGNPYGSNYGVYGGYDTTPSASSAGGARSATGAGPYHPPYDTYGAQTRYNNGAAQHQSPAAPAYQQQPQTPETVASYEYGGYGYGSSGGRDAASASSGYPYGGIAGTVGGDTVPANAQATLTHAASRSQAGPPSSERSPYGYPPAMAPAPSPSQSQPQPMWPAPTSAYPSATTPSSDLGNPYAAQPPGETGSSWQSSPQPLPSQSQPPSNSVSGGGHRARGGASNRPNHVPARPPPGRKVAVASSPSPPRAIQRNRGPPPEYMTCSNEPPYANVDFVGVDNGNANAKFFRPSTQCLPGEERLVKDSRVPFGAILAPLSQSLHSGEEVKLVRHPKPPVRCHRCRGYFSCHASILEMGRKWECPLCDVVNEVPAEEDSIAVDSMGRNIMLPDHPELNFGGVEFDVDGFPEYALRSEDNVVLPPRPLHHLFLIDISSESRQRFLADYVEAIRAALQQMAEATPECRVSFITFASQLHFYDFLHPDMPQLCVPDVDNPFVPLPFASLCWMEVGADQTRVERFLSSLVAIAADTDEVDCAVGAAVKVATLVLAGQHGGRVIVCTSRHPQRGIGSFTARDQHKLYGTDREKELLRPIEGFWTTTAVSAAKQQISFDLFMFSNGYCELVTLSNICHVTNGHVFLFSNYDSFTDSPRITAAMQQLLTEEAGYAGLLRVRCSAGLRVQRYQGHYLSQTAQDMDLASITGSSTFFVEFEHEGKIPKDTYALFQAALLYTTRSGHRRVRVLSCRLRVASNIALLFRNMDLEATLFGVMQGALAEVVNKGVRPARQKMTDRLVKMFLCYRQFGFTNRSRSDTEQGGRTAPTGDTLLMPLRLKLLPSFLLSMMKTEAMVEGTVTPIDHRIASIFDLVTMPTSRLLHYLYPLLFCLSDLDSDPSIGTLDVETGRCIMPLRRQLLFDSVLQDEAYALCDEQAQVVYLWIGSFVPSKASNLLFGTPDAASVCTAGGPGTDYFGERLRNVLSELLTSDKRARRLVVVHQGDRAEEAFFRCLKDENGTDGTGYDELLTYLHHTIQSQVTSNW